MLADEQMGMKWAKNKSKLETGKFPAIWRMRSWNSLKGHECLTYSAILIRFECLNIWPRTISCAAQRTYFTSFSFPFLSQYCSYRFPCICTSSGNLAALASWLDALPKVFLVCFSLKCYPEECQWPETVLCEALKETLRSAVLWVWHMYVKKS